ncbi:MAG: right-handed parallel beta-helix repeat-containing protein [Planctomycetota bacterium]|jgi:predicted outer membrane repeat protein
MKNRLLIAAALAGFSTAQGGTVIYVDDDNCPGPGNGSQVNPYCSIQVAIDAAADGDEIIVAPGTYFESIDLLGKAITARSTDPTDQAVVAATIIDGTGHAHVVACVSGEGPRTVLSGFVVTGGIADGAFPHNTGGGMYIAFSSPTVTDCTFVGNAALLAGGGMANHLGSSPTVANCTFVVNSGQWGAGMLNRSGSHPTVTGCVFTAHADGAMHNEYSSPTIVGSTFIGNSASVGAAMVNDQSSPIVIGCTFSGNAASQRGGAMANLESSPAVTDCAFIGNTAEVSGGAMYSFYDSHPTVIGCRFVGNEAGEGGGMVNKEGSALVRDCLFEENFAYHGGGMWNEDSIPTMFNCRFVANQAQSLGGGMDNFRSTAAITDCVFERNVAGVGGAIGNGGVLAVTGCTFDGNTAQRGGGIHHLGDLGTATFIDCTFTGNSAVGNPSSGGLGGGMMIGFGGPTIIGCVFSGNAAPGNGPHLGQGGAIAGSVTSPTLIDCTFDRNTADEGGGIWALVSEPMVTGCRFRENGGGAMHYASGSPVITRCVFIANAGDRAAGVFSTGSPLIVNSAFLANAGHAVSSEAGSGNGAARGDVEVAPVVTNCTFSGNSGTAVHGADMPGGQELLTTVTNCILWGNGAEIAGPSLVTYSDVRGGWPGPGNIDAGPLFADPDHGDFRLSARSPCIDTGNNTAVPDGVRTDLDGGPRFIDGLQVGAAPIVDMGAYEYRPTLLMTPAPREPDRAHAVAPAVSVP